MNESVGQAGTPPVLRVEDLYKTYPGSTHITKGVSFTTDKDECLGIAGENGSGESTLAECLLILKLASADRATLEGKPLLQRRGKGLCDIRRRFQVVFRSPASSLSSRLTMYDSLLEPLHIRGFISPSFVQPRTQRKVVEQLIGLMRLPASYLDRKPHGFNRGEKQWVAIAWAISVEPTLLIFDEPMASLDVSVQAWASNLLWELREESGLSPVFISHDLNVMQFISECSIVLRNGKVVDRLGHDELFKDGRDQYTRDPIRLFEG